MEMAMALTDLIPWGRSRVLTPARPGEDGNPFFTLQRDVNRILDEFTRGFGASAPSPAGWAGAWPHVDVNETENEFKVVAELPGLEQKDVDVSLHDGVLTLKGEKKSESEGALYSERWHGQFQRSLQLGPEVDPEKVSASFKNGVLSITLAKRADAQSRVKRIPISNA
jgi:HSP20 family protein